MTRRLAASLAVVLAVLTLALGLAAWKWTSMRRADAAAGSQPELVETVTVVPARDVLHRDATTAIGTVMALRSVTVRNELPGTVQQVLFTPGQIVDAGAVLVRLDVSVE
ncbi:MAG: efflux transporter periplasmic adaptor subunit, partial [Candidatus Rokubacteria bacterium]|nr:efflux transporter periplasmic adaptor subunit [Candidatus Rokubacteria bacterium]